MEDTQAYDALNDLIRYIVQENSDLLALLNSVFKNSFKVIALFVMPDSIRYPEDKQDRESIIWIPRTSRGMTGGAWHSVGD